MLITNPRMHSPRHAERASTPRHVVHPAYADHLIWQWLQAPAG